MIESVNDYFFLKKKLDIAIYFWYAMYKGGDKVQRFRLNQSLGDFKVIKVSKRGKIRTDYITTVDGLGEIVISQVYADRKSEYILNPYNPHEILRA